VNLLSSSKAGIAAGVLTFCWLGIARGQSASFLSLDATTQGNWVGVYGQDGYVIPNGVASIPTYATLSYSGASTWTWAASTPDVRAPYSDASASNRMASTFYSNPTTFTINLNLTDGQPHQVALYCLDLDTTNRNETISILNANTNAVLDTQNITNFHNGVYPVWNLQGHVLIQVTNNSGAGSLNAVVSGIFFKGGSTGSGGGTNPPPATSASTATFLKSDSTTKGNWVGNYGQDGYIIANDANIPASYAQVSSAGATTYTWNNPSTDPRALLTSPSRSSRIASTFFSGTNFTFDVNLTDGQPHQVTLYSLDIETNDRSQIVSILDASSGVVLSTQAFSHFSAGLYGVWNIQGHVLIRVTCTGGLNAVVSGVFFGGGGSPVTPPSGGTNPGGGGGTPFITTYAFYNPHLRNDYDSFVGTQLMPAGSTPLTATYVGRGCVAGNSQSHTVKFVYASNGVDVPGGAASVNMTGCTPGQFAWAALPAPISLMPGVAYYLVTLEYIGGDMWYEKAPVTTESFATIISAVYLQDNGAWHPIAPPNYAYAPPNFK